MYYIIYIHIQHVVELFVILYIIAHCPTSSNDGIKVKVRPRRSDRSNGNPRRSHEEDVGV